MSTTFSRIVEKYGDETVLYFTSGGSEETKCFVQPVLRRTYERDFYERTAQGVKDTARYYGFFPAGASMEDCGYIACGETEYDILKAEPYRVNGRLSHWEALMTKREEAYGG